MRKPKLFISYCSEDERFVEQLTSDLEEQEVDIWHFKRDLSPGAIIWTEINKKINEYGTIGVVLSTDSVNSIGVKLEIENAYRLFGESGRTFIIPILKTELKKETIPNEIKGLYWADFSISYYLGLQQLLKAFGKNFDGLSEARIQWLNQSENIGIFSLKILKLLSELTCIQYSQFILAGKELHANRYVVLADSIPDGMLRYRLVSLTGLIGRCLLSGKTVFESNVKSLSDYLEAEHSTTEELVVPILSKKLGVIGAFNFESKEKRLADIDQSFLQNIGKVVGEMIDKKGWLPVSIYNLPSIWMPNIYFQDVNALLIGNKEMAAGIEQMQRIQDKFDHDEAYKDIRMVQNGVRP